MSMMTVEVVQLHSSDASREQTRVQRGRGALAFRLHTAMADLAGPRAPAPKIYLMGPLLPGWSVEQPLAIDVQIDEDGSFVVSDDVFLMYGVGATLEEAQHDHAVALIEYYTLTRDDALRNGPTRSMFRYLQRYLRPDSM